MKPEYQRMYQRIAETHAATYDAVSNVRTRAVNSQTLEDLADLAYVLRECEQLLDDSRKEVKRLAELVTQKVCLIHTHKALASGAKEAEPIRTEHCTVSPTLKMSANVPSREGTPEAYRAYMQALGATDEQIKSDTLRPHWPSVTEWLTARLASGLPEPDGIEQSSMRPTYKLQIRANKDILA